NEQLSSIQRNLSGVISGDLLLKDRTDYVRPIETRIQNAQEVSISGKSLIGFITTYQSLFLKHAKRGCKFRFLINNPSSISTTTSERSDIEQTLRRLANLHRITPYQIDARLSPVIIHSSILMIDDKSSSGEIQIEFYAHHMSASDRPHITLFSDRDP